MRIRQLRCWTVVVNVVVVMCGPGSSEVLVFCIVSMVSCWAIVLIVMVRI